MVFFGSFFGLILIMAILEAFTSNFVRGQNPAKMNRYELKIWNGEATLIDRIWLFFTSVIRNLMAPFLMLPALVITFIAWIIIAVFV